LEVGDRGERSAVRADGCEDGDLPHEAGHDGRLATVGVGGDQTLFIDAGHDIEVAGEVGLARDIALGAVGVGGDDSQLLESLGSE
jgi:hypothetical protein